MSQQQTSENKVWLSTSAQPPQMFDEEPTIIIFDRNGYIVDQRIDLKPFTAIADIINNENNLRHKLNGFNRSFIIACILPQCIHPEVRAFVNEDILHRRVTLFCLFFIDGQNSNMRALGGNRLIGCYSITSRISGQTRDVCARANDLNINYCEHHRLLNEGRGNNGLAEVYVRQRDHRLSLQLEYNEQLLREFEQRR